MAPSVMWNLLGVGGGKNRPVVTGYSAPTIGQLIFQAYVTLRGGELFQQKFGHESLFFSSTTLPSMPLFPQMTYFPGQEHNTSSKVCQLLKRARL